jgi:hypothetical protein
MGNLTDDMTRLRGEVDALRSDRGALMQELARGAKDLASTVSAMQADFAAAHAAMAKQARGEREAFVAAVIDEVNSLLGEFSRDRNDMARKGRHDRGVFLSEMKRQVTGMCKETADDLMGARLAWRGESPRKSRPVQLKKEPAVVKPLSPPVGSALKKKTVAAPAAAPAVKTPKVKAPPSVSASKPPFQKSKEKSWLDKKPAKTTKGKRGKK